MITGVERGYGGDESPDQPELVLRVALQLQDVGGLLGRQVQAQHLRAGVYKAVIE